MTKAILVFSILFTAVAGKANAQTWSKRQLEFLHDFTGARTSLFEQIVFVPMKDSTLGHLYAYSVDDGKQIVQINLEKVKAPIDLEGAMVHEAIHHYFYNLNKTEDTWAMEGIAMLGEFLYDLKHFEKADVFNSFSPLFAAYKIDSIDSISSFKQNPADYGKVLLFYLSLYENFGGKYFVKTYLKTKRTGMAAILEAISKNSKLFPVPEGWIDASFIEAEFLKSMQTYENTLATSANGFFTQILLQLND